MKYGATPLIRMLGPKRRTSGTRPFGPSVPGGVPGPDSPDPDACSATCGVRLIRRTSAADMLGTDCVSRDRVFMAIFFRVVSRLLVSDGGLNEFDTESLGFGAGHRPGFWAGPGKYMSAPSRRVTKPGRPMIVEVPGGPKLEANGPLLCGATGRSCRHRHALRPASSAGA